MKKLWLIAVLPVALLIWWGVSRGETSVTLHFTTARSGTIESIVSTNGKVEPAESAAARAATAGVVRNIFVQRGQQVRAGQKLVLLDLTPARSELAGAIAKEREARAEFDVVDKGGKESAVANLNDSIRTAQEAVASAERNYDVLVRLAAQQAATKLQVQDAKDALARARLNLEALQDQKKTLVSPADKSVAEARLRDAEAGVSLARHRFQLGVVRAPINGTLYQFDLKIGSYLQPGDLVGTIGTLDQVKVIVYVDEPDLGRVALDMPVTISWDAHPGQKWIGRVNKLPSEVVALNTRAVGDVTTVVENANYDLLPGVSVNAQILSKVAKDAVTIPRAALRNFRGVSGVFKLNGERVVWTPITAGVSDVNNVQVTAGLRVGDQVADRVVEPSDAELKDGMRVKSLVD